MSMTREEAVKALRLEGGLEISGNARRLSEFMQGLDVSLTALRGPTREMVERMRGERVSTGAISCRCSYCGHTELKTRATEYSCCPLCMSPMTDEAVDMMLERWKEAIQDG